MPAVLRQNPAEDLFSDTRDSPYRVLRPLSTHASLSARLSYLPPAFEEAFGTLKGESHV